MLCPFKCNARLRGEIEPQGAKWHKPNFCTEIRLDGLRHMSVIPDDIKVIPGLFRPERLSRNIIDEG